MHPLEVKITYCAFKWYFKITKVKWCVLWWRAACEMSGSGEVTQHSVNSQPSREHDNRVITWCVSTFQKLPVPSSHAMVVNTDIETHKKN